MMHGLSAVKFELDSNKRTRGDSCKLTKKRFRADLRQHFFTERNIYVWNSLDEQTVGSCSLNSRASLLYDFSREISRDLYETIVIGKFKSREIFQNRASRRSLKITQLYVSN